MHGDHDLLRAYIQDLLQAAVPQLKPHEEVELGTLLQTLPRDSRRWQAARERLVAANVRLVITWAKRYDHRGVPLIDLIQEGNLGLMRAAEKYDPSVMTEQGTPVRFSTYASWWIKQALSRACSEQSRAIRLPPYIADEVRRLERAELQLADGAIASGSPELHEVRAAVTDAQLLEHLGWDADHLREIRSYIHPTVSLEQPLTASSRPGTPVHLADTLEAPAPAAERATDDELERIFDAVGLTYREKQVIRLRYGLHPNRPDLCHTLLETGKQFGISRERVRQIETAALIKLKRRIPEIALRLGESAA